MGGLHELNGKVPEGGKIGKSEDTTSIWSFIRAYGDALSKTTKTDLSIGHGHQGVYADQDFHKAHNEIFDAYQAVNADDIDVKSRIQQATSIIGRKPELYQTTYNSVLYSLSKQILQNNVINQYHVDRLQTILGVADEISGNAAPTFQEVVDIWHLQHMLPKEKPGRIVDEWPHLKAREFARYVMGKDSISEAAYEAVQELLGSHAMKSSEKDEYVKEIERLADTNGIRLHHSGKDDMSKGQHARLDKLEQLLDAAPDSKIDAISTITPGRVAELRVQLG